MNSLLRHKPDREENLVTTRPRTHWVDTDGLLEAYSHGDLYFDWALSRCTRPPLLNPKADPEKRRLRLQQALWMAMALAESEAVSLSYQHENLRNILRLAPPDSEVGGWTSTILYVLGDGGVFDGWDRIVTTSGEAVRSDLDRDRLVVLACSGATAVPKVEGMDEERKRSLAEALQAIRQHTPGPLVLVTHDRELIRRARKVGVDADEPDVVAARTISREDARIMFAARLTEATAWYLAVTPLRDRLLLERGMERVHELHEAIWTASSDVWFPPPADGF